MLLSYQMIYHYVSFLDEPTDGVMVVSCELVIKYLLIYFSSGYLFSNKLLLQLQNCFGFNLHKHWNRLITAHDYNIQLQLIATYKKKPLI